MFMVNIPPYFIVEQTSRSRTPVSSVDTDIRERLEVDRPSAKLVISPGISNAYLQSTPWRLCWPKLGIYFVSVARNVLHLI